MEKQQNYEHEDVVLKADDPSLEIDRYVPGTDEEKKLVRKIDSYILPMMWVMYLMSYMDRTK